MKLLLPYLLLSTIFINGCNRQGSRDSAYDSSPIPSSSIEYFRGDLDKGSATVVTGPLEGKQIYIFLDDNHESILSGKRESGPYFVTWGETVIILGADKFSKYLVEVIR